MERDNLGREPRTAVLVSALSATLCPTAAAAASSHTKAPRSPTCPFALDATGRRSANPRPGACFACTKRQRGPWGE
jgi:hypothetical protein